MSLFTVNMLVADKSRVIQQIFRDLAERSRLPIELTASADAQESLDLLAGNKIDVAFIDVDLPDMGGIELIRRARAAGSRSLLALTALHAALPSSTTARELGVYEVLEKPFAPADAEAIIGNYRRLSAPMSALLVDDSPTVRKVMQKVLAGSIFNITVESAATGEEALVACATNGFDLVFLDWNMPGLDGLQTLQQLRGRDKDARVIMMSGDRSEERVSRATMSGAAAFLRKPFFTADVDRALHAAFDLQMPRLAAAVQEETLEKGLAALVARKAELAAGA